MTKTLNKKLNEYWAPLVVVVIAFSSVFGHAYGVDSLKQFFSTGAVDMKLGTAVMMIAAGSHQLTPNIRFIMVILVFGLGSVYFGYISPIDVPASMPYTVKMNLPSLGTLACFALYVWGELRESRAIGRMLQIVSVIAGIGYLLDVPILFYYYPGVSTAMAIHTSILFWHLGVHQTVRNDWGSPKSNMYRAIKKWFQKKKIKSRIADLFIYIMPLK